MTDNVLAKRKANVLRFQQAIGDKEPVRMRYGGGSQPGAQRSIMPLRIQGEDTKTRVMGMDQATGLPKNYTMDKLDTLSMDEPEEAPMYVGSEGEKQKARDYRQRQRSEGGRGDPVEALTRYAREAGYQGDNLQEAMDAAWNMAPTDGMGELIEAVSKRAGVAPPWVRNPPSR